VFIQAAFTNYDGGRIREYNILILTHWLSILSYKDKIVTFPLFNTCYPKNLARNLARSLEAQITQLKEYMHGKDFKLQLAHLIDKAYKTHQLGLFNLKGLLIIFVLISNLSLCFSLSNSLKSSFSRFISYVFYKSGLLVKLFLM